MRLLIKFATRNRPEKFMAAMRNIESTIKGTDYKIIVSLDEDDEPMKRIAEKYEYDRTEFWINAPAGKIAAINANVPLSGWDWLVNMSDDMVFVTNGWNEIMEQKIKSVWGDSLDWFANFNDGYQGEKLPTMSIMGREYYERFFYIYAPCYKSLSCDAEAMYVAMALKRYHYFPDILFKHQHPANTKGVKSDQLYVANETHQKQDTRTYFTRLLKDFYVNVCGPTPFDRFKALAKKRLEQ
jgi:hypothetical protein